MNIVNRTLFAAFPLVLIAAFCGSAVAQKHITGTLQDGAAYVIDVPAKWNGTLLLYSHGYTAAGGQNPAYDVGDYLTGGYLLNAGYALAGSSYSTTGWAVHEAIPDQIGTLDVFQSLVGTPTQTIAWGHSLGGMITAGLVEQYPNRFSGALPMCGVVGGGVGLWNTVLDVAFTFNALLAGGSLQIVNIADPLTNYQNAEGWLGYAQGSPQGQARIALAAAMADVPGWFDPGTPEPAPTDYATQQSNQFLWLAYDDFPFAFYYRAELEGRAGGNFSWNTGVNYAMQLKRSANNAEVQALYTAAGLNLAADLAALQKAARIAVDQTAEQYVIQNIVYNGQVPIPVLTLHTTGDGLVTPENEQAYMAVAKKAGDNSFVHDLFVHRAGHCTFTPAETVAAFETLTTRMKTGKWKGVDPTTLDNEAVALGPSMNVLYLNGQLVHVSPAFEMYHPSPFLRPFDAFSHELGK
jgi:pimeloyl-ACP methyl ester carboxylesterase